MKNISLLIMFTIIVFIGCSKESPIKPAIQEGWIKTNGPNEGNISALIVAPNGDIVAGTPSNGFFISKDNGTNWSGPFSNGMYVNSLTKSGNSLYAGGKGGVYISTDNGKKWTSAGMNGTTIYSVFATNTGALLCGSGFIWRSENNGNYWPKTGSPYNTVLCFAQSKSNTIFAGTEGDGIYRSTDDGLSWSRIGLDDHIIMSICISDKWGIFAGTGGNGVYKSTDNGSTWEKTNIPNIDIPTLCIDTDGSILAGMIGVFRTTDGGDSWTGSLNNTIVKCVLVVPTDKSVIAGTDLLNDGIYRSHDGLKSWNKVGLLCSRIQTLCVLGETVFAGTKNSGIHLTTDNGTIWKHVGLGTGSVISIVNKSPGIVFAAMDGWDGDKGVYRSDDGGSTWVKKDKGIEDARMTTLYVAPNGTIYSSTLFEIYYSTDNGESWNKVSDWSANCLIVNSNGYIFRGTGHGVSRSTDNGISWQFFGPDSVDIVSLAIDQSGLMFSGGSAWNGAVGGLFKSSNLGETWNRVELPEYFGSVMTIIINQNDDLIVCTSNGVCVSQDLGVSWNKTYYLLIDDLPADQWFSTMVLGIDGTIFVGTTSLNQGSGVLKRKY
ncbi:MAG: sialidase family protein [bacterium]